MSFEQASVVQDAGGKWKIVYRKKQEEKLPKIVSGVAKTTGRGMDAVPYSRT
jgi:hypothetical protein